MADKNILSQIVFLVLHRSAARDIGNKMCLRKETRTALKVKAVETFPNIKSWTGAQLQEIGLVAGNNYVKDDMVYYKEMECLSQLFLFHMLHPLTSKCF